MRLKQLFLAVKRGGHGTSDTRVNVRRDAQGRPLVGQYLVSEIDFVMPGTWEMRIRLVDPAGGHSEMKSFPVKVRGENTGSVTHHTH
ncbi:MAG: hypothetical protein COT74_02060 [Bdellovibrionales bacterium CG10_big_fil_rev_8_21_14_0_10_45_34]|nr:MAG: hypothetical protein COT74_02060 [Bdellovibrionales bacterium CG10_big_fil_rev_8_21_14_0_10_45_34]